MAVDIRNFTPVNEQTSALPPKWTASPGTDVSPGAFTDEQIIFNNIDFLTADMVYISVGLSSFDAADSTLEIFTTNRAGTVTVADFVPLPDSLATIPIIPGSDKTDFEVRFVGWERMLLELTKGGATTTGTLDDIIVTLKNRK